MKPEVKAILDQVRSTADFGYVAFTDINDTNELGDNALHCVIVWGDYTAAKILIENGINIHQPGEFGFTPLRHAIDFEQPEIAQLLLAHGAVPALDRKNLTENATTSTCYGFMIPSKIWKSRLIIAAARRPFQVG